VSAGSLLAPAPLKWTYVYALGDSPTAAAWHRDAWVQTLAGVDGVSRVVVHEARKAPQPEDVSRPLNDWAGLVEVHVDDASVVADSLVPLVRAELGGRLSALRGLVTTVAEEYDLRRDVPAQQHPYATETITWKNNPPPAGEPGDTDDLWRYVYLFRYRDDVPWTEGEDWYLGHHTREGRQLPGLRRYVTWRRRRCDAMSGPDAELFNGFARYTELCFETFDEWHRATHLNGPRWRMAESWPTGVWTDYHQLFLGTTPTVDTAAT
jgi:hypothetical protein